MPAKTIKYRDGDSLVLGEKSIVLCVDVGCGVDSSLKILLHTERYEAPWMNWPRYHTFLISEQGLAKAHESLSAIFALKKGRTQKLIEWVEARFFRKAGAAP